MRKIAANYICLPGFPLVKNGYVILEQGRVKEEGDLLLPWLGEIYRRGGEEYQGVGIWEGADLLKLTWTNKTKFRLL